MRRLAKRGHYDAATIHAILDAGFLAHVGFSVDGEPVVIPTLYGRDGDTLILHGAASNRMLGALGAPACVTVTLVDGIVLARSAFHHSMNYRSVVAFGRAQPIADEAEKTRALAVVSEHLLRGRWAEVRAPNQAELRSTAVVRFAIEEASAKIRTGPPVDEEADYALPVWAGVVPLELRRGAPQPDPRLAEATPIPPYLL